MIDLLILTGALLNPTPITAQNTPNNMYNSQHNNGLVEHNIVDGDQSYSINLLTKEIHAELQHQLALLLVTETTLEVNQSPLDNIAISNNY